MNLIETTVNHDKIFFKIMMKMSRTELARWGEEMARKFLVNKNVQIIETNYRTSSGEVDIIGFENLELVFFEVKTRSSIRFGFPEDAVDERKIEKIENVANDFLDERPYDDVNWRIDTIAIIRNPNNGKYEIRWFKNVSE
jgi:putative endonuclease